MNGWPVRESADANGERTKVTALIITKPNQLQLSGGNRGYSNGSDEGALLAGS